MMERKEAINYLLYMKHDVLANSPYDVALDIAIEVLKATVKQPKTNGDRIRQMTDEDDGIARCDRCGTYVDKDTMYAGICAECQAEDEAKSKQTGWCKIEEIIKEVLPHDSI